ncbi:MAG: hypothetical protein U5L96_14385 [Owenweeksia sp.]|nr:hypothetical protein [Owenweeksia sp.]
MVLSLMERSLTSASFSGSSMAVRADVSGFNTVSVIFGLDGNPNFKSENVAPYSLKGDKGGALNGWSPTLGSHTLTATAYSNYNGNGIQGPTISVSFTVVNGTQLPPDCNGDAGGAAFIDDCGECVAGNTGKSPNAAKDSCGVCFGNGTSCNGGGCVANEVVSLSLMNAGSAGPVGQLTNGYLINKSLTGPVSVGGQSCSGPVGSVIFTLNGQQIKLENIAPSINGDNHKGFKAWNVGVGTYTLTATPYSRGNGNGVAGVATTVNFSVVDDSYAAVDCNGVVGGSAFMDDCGECSGGNTGKTPMPLKMIVAYVMAIIKRRIAMVIALVRLA